MITGSNALRNTAWSALVFGGPASVVLMLYAARQFRPPAIVAILFVLWVFSPFALLMIAAFAGKRWSLYTRTALYGVMLVVTLGTLALYAVLAFAPPRTRLVPIFVLVPPVSWALTLIVVSVSGLMSRSRGGANAG